MESQGYIFLEMIVESRQIDLSIYL